MDTVNAVKGTSAPPNYTSEQLRVARARANISGRELGRRLGVSPNWVSLRETDQQPITAEDAVQIAEALGVSQRELLGAPPPAPRPGRRRGMAPVLTDVQDFLDDPLSTSREKQFLLQSIRGLLNMTIESRDGIPAEPQTRGR